MNKDNLSSKMIHRTFTPLNIQFAKYPVVQNGREALAEFVRLQMEERNWSTYDVVRESGGLITSNGTIWNVVNLRVKDVKEKTLRGIAKAFKISDTEVFEIYYGKKQLTSNDLEDDESIAALFYEYKELTEEDKQELRTTMEIVRQEIRRRRAAGELASQKNSKKVRIR